MKKRLRAACYLRCSTKKQETSIRDQKAACIKYAAEHNIEIVAWYIDDGISGDDTEKRTAFLQMREDVDSGEFNAVLCWDQDRFGRCDSLESGHWIYPFRKAGVVLITTTDGTIDWECYLGRVMYSLKQEAAHEHNVKLSRNVLRGQVEAAKRGSWVGTVPYGYRLVGERKNRKLSLDSNTKVRVVERIFREFTEHRRSMSGIATRLNEKEIPGPRGDLWRFDTVKWILKNPAYTGTYRFNRSSRSKYHTFSNGVITSGGRRGMKPETDWIVIANNHPAIISQATFDEAQARLELTATGQQPYTPENTPYLLSGMLRCGGCGKNMVGLNNNKFNYYECSRRNREKGCEGNTVREDKVLQLITEYVEEQFIPSKVQSQLARKAREGTLTEKDLPQAFAKLRRMMLGKTKRRADPARIEKEVQQIDAKLSKVTRNLAYVDPKHIAGLQAELEALADERSSLMAELKAQPTEADINTTVRTVLKKLVLLSNCEPGDVKQVLREFSHITVYTRKRAHGTKTRYDFLRGEVHLRVGTPTGKVNPRSAD